MAEYLKYAIIKQGGYMKILILFIISFSVSAKDRYPFNYENFIKITNKNCAEEIQGFIDYKTPEGDIVTSRLPASVRKFKPYDQEGNKLTTFDRFNLKPIENMIGFFSFVCNDSYSVDFFYHKENGKVKTSSISLRKKDDFVMRLTDPKKQKEKDKIQELFKKYESDLIKKNNL